MESASAGLYYMLGRSSTAMLGALARTELAACCRERHSHKLLLKAATAVPKGD